MSVPVVSPITTFTTNACDHGNGDQLAIVAITAGSTDNGAKPPLRKVRTEKYRLFSADTLVSQNALSASTHSITNRSTAPPTRAGTNASTCSGVIPDRSPSNTTIRMIIAGPTPNSPMIL